MKNESGSKTVNNNPPLLTQARWRIAGILSTAGSAILAWTGAQANFYIDSPLRAILHWGAFLVLLGITFLVVWLDLRYIRVLYALQRRDAFRQTLGEQEFRQALLQAQQDKNTERKDRP